MIVVDTHAWIWWMDDPAKLSRKARTTLNEEDEICLSAISCWELGMLTAKGRLQLDRDVLLWIRQSLAKPKMTLIPLLPEIAVQATRLPQAFPGDPGDRIIYSTARHLGVSLVTRDAQLRRHDPATTVW